MFLGHYAVGLAAKRAAPRMSLGTALLASQFLDVLWPIFVLAGWERVRVAPGNTRFTPLDFVSYPYSHSLAAALFWAASFSAVYWLVRRYRVGAWVAAACVASHWALDLLTHRPDLALFPGGSARVGLGLWNSVPGTAAVELALFAAGLLLYARSTVARDRTGRWALAGFVVVLLAAYAAAALGPPPPSPSAVAWGDIASFVLIAWGAWVDRHRSARV